MNLPRDDDDLLRTPPRGGRVRKATDVELFATSKTTYDGHPELQCLSGNWKLDTGNNGCWASHGNPADEEFILHLQEPKRVIGVVIQGRSVSDQKVTHLKISTSRDGVHWELEGDFLGVEGNLRDAHFLRYFRDSQPKLVSSVKFHEMRYSGHMSLRAALDLFRRHLIRAANLGAEGDQSVMAVGPQSRYVYLFRQGELWRFEPGVGVEPPEWVFLEQDGNGYETIAQSGTMIPEGGPCPGPTCYPGSRKYPGFVASTESNSLFMYGGGTPPAFNDVWEYFPPGNWWTKHDNSGAPAVSRSPCLWVLPEDSGVFIFGGTENPSRMTYYDSWFDTWDSWAPDRDSSLYAKLSWIQTTPSGSDTILYYYDGYERPLVIGGFSRATHTWQTYKTYDLGYPTYEGESAHPAEKYYAGGTSFVPLGVGGASYGGKALFYAGRGPGDFRLCEEGDRGRMSDQWSLNLGTLTWTYHQFEEADRKPSDCQINLPDVSLGRVGQREDPCMAVIDLGYGDVRMYMFGTYATEPTYTFYGRNDMWESPYSCYGVFVGDDAVCSGHGECTLGGICECDFGWVHHDCSIPLCDGLWGNDTDVCSGRGICTLPEDCDCSSGSFGSRCQSTAGAVVGGLVGSFGGVAILVFIVLIVLLAFRISAAKKERDSRSIPMDEELPQIKRLTESAFQIPYDAVSLIEDIGSGGGGAVVYRATWKDTIVAYKLFRMNPLGEVDASFDEFEVRIRVIPSLNHSDKREVGIMTSISHPNILRYVTSPVYSPLTGQIFWLHAPTSESVRVFLFFVCAEAHLIGRGIVMELCEHGDLRHAIHAKVIAGDDEKVRILRGIASGMEYLHENRIIHRDLKPENVLIDGDLVPKIMDFGLSRMKDGDDGEMTKWVGTSTFMAPELIVGKHYDSKVDVYAFGLLIYEVLYENFTPFKGMVAGSIEPRIAADPDFRPHVDMGKFVSLGWLQKIMANCWDYDPLCRPSFESIMIGFRELSEAPTVAKTVRQRKRDTGFFPSASLMLALSKSSEKSSGRGSSRSRASLPPDFGSRTSSNHQKPPSPLSSRASVHGVMLVSDPVRARPPSPIIVHAASPGNGGVMLVSDPVKSGPPPALPPRPRGALSVPPPVKKRPPPRPPPRHSDF